MSMTVPNVSGLVMSRKDACCSLGLIAAQLWKLQVRQQLVGGFSASACAV